MAISAEKWVVMALIFVISLVLGLIPYFLLPKVKSWATVMAKSGYHILLTILSCFGAGVLLTTAAMHMLPENREALAEIKSIWETLDEHFPLAETLMLSGFALIYLIEEVAHLLLDGSSAPGHNHDHGHGGPNHQPHHHHLLTSRNSLVHRLSIASGASVSLKKKETRPSIASIGNGHGHLHTSVQVTPSQCHTHGHVHDGANSHTSNSNHGHGHGKPELYGPNEIIFHDEPIPEDEQPVTLVQRLRSLLAVLALSFHAIMEGIAIGIEDSNSVWFMFGAISAHKFVISFCMGMELCASKSKLSTIFTSVFIFAILSPIGIGIGSSMAGDDEPNGLAVSMIQGFAAGTILYVIFFEILSRERERKAGSLKDVKLAGFIQFLSFTVGLVAMAVLLNVVSEHEHGHGHEEDECPEHEPHRNSNSNMVLIEYYNNLAGIPGPAPVGPMVAQSST